MGQVSHHTSPGRCARQGEEDRICPVVGEGSALHQGTKVCLAQSSRESDYGWQGVVEDFVGREQALEHCLPAEGIFRAIGQLWDYSSEAWARRFFENWKASLKWQRLKPYEKFAEMIERHRDGIAVYCRPENKVSLGFVEGLNNKIRVIQRRAYGLRDEEYLRLKILTSMLPKI